MNLVGILIGLVVIAIFFWLLNMILDKLLTAMGLGGWKQVLLGIIGFIVLLAFLSRMGLSGGYF